MAARMQAKDDGAAGRFFHAQALGANGHATVAADFDRGAHAPDVGPPGTTGSGSQDGAIFFLGLVPGAQRGLTQFTMDFLGVAMMAQRVEVPIGFLKIGDFFAGEIGRQAALPELMFAFDFALGLRRGGVAQADVIEFECAAQLRERFGIVREEDAMVIHVELKRTTVLSKGGGQEIEVSEQQFTFVEFGTGKEAAAIIEHIEHGESGFGLRKPTVRRSIQLPEFADLGALPAAHRGENPFGRNRMGQSILQGPAADLGAIEFEGMQAQGFRSGEAVRARGFAGQAFFEQVQNRLRPRLGMIAAGSAGQPKVFLFFGASTPICSSQRVKTAGRKIKLAGCFGGAQRMLTETFEHMADIGRRVAME